ncbi:hypothetical protein ACQCQP_16015 [Ralstonia pseudosolanacearum]|uniref:hypothetical protein n=1 Tax=Burkholderiaceae TaxID=119060 RepID=UPI00163F5452|nr:MULTISPECIES: hypothetical protein [Burkholderia]QTO48340.1 hypothetical protein J8I86_15225 [Burkholderia latens]
MIHRAALALAITATSTAVCTSVLAGLHRGGWLSERLVWVAIGVVLIAGAHLLPALCRSAPIVVRCVSALLWLGCMAAASYGHATFFLLSQSHAGNARVSAVPVAAASVHRSLTVVMTERATVTTQLAQANARRCIGNCPVLRGLRTGLAARLDALDAEAGEVRRYQTTEDRDTARRDAIRDDPVTARMAALGGVAPAKLDLLTGLAFAAVLEGMACLLWWIALSPGTHVAAIPDSQSVTAAVFPEPESMTHSAAPVSEPDTEIAKLVRDIQAGIVKPTVSGIRQHLRCSQSKAAALRRTLTELTT